MRDYDETMTAANGVTMRPVKLVTEKPFARAASENIGAGVGVATVVYCTLSLWHGMPVDNLATPLLVGGAFAGMLCAYRWGSDEIGSCYATIRNKLDVSSYLSDIHVLLREVEDRDRQIAEMQRRLTQPPAGKKTSSMTVPAWNGVDHHYNGAQTLDDWFAEHGAADDTSGQHRQSPLSDDDLDDINRAHRLLNHLASFGTLSKHSAYEKSNISHKDWRLAIDFLMACGAVHMDGKAYTLRVAEIADADSLIDTFVRGRVEKIERLGVHTPA